ncbi:SWAP (Suppressor-of-White-APricot)/surp domain-containing protein [Dorcoceras hygrometricum]|uniref:SWAP (Suppressor-of-White-APricot)/surp domain-containing protein n=1 Tax=Dorcoceras hygrometricum TaxID=472368 RepID=A0A2Z7CNR3_9LAMI|nr:SWAP (Suppressor-of-White-APricot)/surp domain-containing protein [Dorcoceras hygrometricum]
MDKAKDRGMFVNDGSFMERFKQLQQEKDKKHEVREMSLSGSSTSVTSYPKTVNSKPTLNFKANNSKKSVQSPSSGKLAFSLKQKSKLVSPAVKFDEDEDGDEKEPGNSSDDGPAKRPKLAELGVSDQQAQADVVPPLPSDLTVRKVADKLASFVAKNGRQFEHVTRQKNPGDTPFKFLFDENCSDYKYYLYRLSEEQKSLAQSRDAQTAQNGTATTPHSRSSSQRSHHQHSKYQTSASALYESAEHMDNTHPTQITSGKTVLSLSLSPLKFCSSDLDCTMGKLHSIVVKKLRFLMVFCYISSYSCESSTPTASDPIAMMEFYMKKAAQEEKLRPPKPSKDEMPPPAALQASTKKGHHMGDYIPLEELEKFMASCNDASAQKTAKEYADRAKIQADNVGHKLLSKMGWKEGEGLGSSKSGIAAPIMAGDVKKDNLGIGAHAPGEVTPEDDIYEQYKKRMMLGYRHRPNPLVYILHTCERVGFSSDGH